MFQVDLSPEPQTPPAQSVAIKGSGELEIVVSDETAVSLAVDQSAKSLVLRPSARTKIAIRDTQHLALSGSLTVDALQRKLSGQAELTFTFSDATRFDVNYVRDSGGHTIGAKITIRL